MTRITYMMGTSRYVAVVARTDLRAWLAKNAHVTILRCESN